MNDILEQGTNFFIQHILSQDNMPLVKEELVLVTSQMVSFKEFGEKLNVLLCEISTLNSMENEMEIMLYLSKNLRKVFSSERLNCWLVDAVII